MNFDFQDYDYSYDYSDFTIKPPGQQSSSSSTDNPPSSSTALSPSKPIDNENSFPILSPKPSPSTPEGTTNSNPHSFQEKPSSTKPNASEASAGQIPVIVVTNPVLEDNLGVDDNTSQKRETTTGIPEKFAGILASSASPPISLGKDK